MGEGQQLVLAGVNESKINSKINGEIWAILYVI